MTVICIANLNDFNFLFVDTLVTRQNSDEKLELIRQDNKLRFINDFSFFYTGSGPGEIFQFVDNYFQQNKFDLRHRKVRETIVDYINSNLHNISSTFYQPGNTTIACICRPGVILWDISLDTQNNSYSLMTDPLDIRVVNTNEYKLLWFGFDTLDCGLLNNLDRTNIQSNVFKRMQDKHGEWKRKHNQDQLQNLNNFSYGVISKPKGNNFISLYIP